MTERGSLAVLWLLFSVGAGTCFLSASDDETINFHYDYQAAIKEARETGKPIFLEFRCAP